MIFYLGVSCCALRLVDDGDDVGGDGDGVLAEGAGGAVVADGAEAEGEGEGAAGGELGEQGADAEEDEGGWVQPGAGGEGVQQLRACVVDSMIALISGVCDLCPVLQHGETL